jgi:hypothetical protein
MMYNPICLTHEKYNHRESQGRGSGLIPTMAIVSAMYAVTDKLIGAVNAALSSPDEARAKLNEVVEKQLATIRELAPPEISDIAEKNIKLVLLIPKTETKNHDRWIIMQLVTRVSTQERRGGRDERFEGAELDQVHSCRCHGVGDRSRGGLVRSDIARIPQDQERTLRVDRCARNP